MQEIIFKANGDFGAYYAACDWLKENGYSYGSMQRHDPVGVVKGDYHIAKWRNLSKSDIEALDGTMHPCRGGDCVVRLKQ